MNGVLVNDVHSRLNPTRVDEVERRRSLKAIQHALARASGARKPVSICGGRHAIGDAAKDRGTLKMTPGQIAIRGHKAEGRAKLSSWFGVLAAVASAAVVWLRFNFTLFEYVVRLIGANVDRALVIVVLCGVATLVVLPFVRTRRALVATLAFAASALFAGLVLVAVDRFTYETRVTPEGFFSADGPTRTETHHLWFLAGLWGVPLALLVSRACRLLGASGRRSTVVVLAVAAAGVGGVAATAHPQAAVAGATKAASEGPPHGVLVCRNPLMAPEALGGWQCPQNTDIGRTAIEPPQSLLCLSDLSNGEGVTIDVRVFCRGYKIKSGHFPNSDSNQQAYTAIEPSDIPQSDGQRLPRGRYVCRFAVNGRTVHERTFTLR
jgi:hypothetical protein